MAYCNYCGAYIPDGQATCMACGKMQGQAAAEKQADEYTQSGFEKPSSEELKQQLEEKRKKQQEQSREWAQQAYKEYKSNSAHNTSGAKGAEPFSGKPVSENSKKTLGKVLSVLSYISVGCFLPFLITKDDEFAKFHGKQGILLFALSILIDILGGLKSVAFLLGIARIYFMYVGIKNVLNGKMEKLPYIGDFADRF